MNQTASNPIDTMTKGQHIKFLKVMIAGQIFGIHAMDVEDILDSQEINHIPLAPSYVKGSVNLRGKIVTVIDLREKYKILESVEEGKEASVPELHVVISQGDDFFSILVDEVYEVLDLEVEKIDMNPATLDARWQDVSSGVYQLDGELLLLLETQALIKAS